MGDVGSEGDGEVMVILKRCFLVEEIVFADSEFTEYAQIMSFS